jgi:tRNA pseudouridine55 synthase
MNSGILLLDKPTGSSSAKALYPVKRLFPGRKVGHTGTLDPFASGLLVILVGHATRLSRFFLKLDKRYTGILKFGEETDTLDRLGEVTCTAPIPPSDRVARETAGFLGKNFQMPPSYSALKVNGKRAYSLARQGITPELAPREITVHEISIVPLQQENSGPPREPIDRYRLDVHCESGTYIRALARDIGRASGSCAILEELRRTMVGPFDIAEADPEQLISVPAAVARLGTIPVVPVDSVACSRIRMGKDPLASLSDPSLADFHSMVTPATSHVLFVDPAGQEVALLERDAPPEPPGVPSSQTAADDDRAGRGWKYAAVFPSPEGVPEPPGEHSSGRHSPGADR